jgi:hypothetical protein
MLTLFAAHIIISASCLWSGFLFYKLFYKKTEGKPAVYYFISGLILLSVLSQLLALFFPIGSRIQWLMGSLLMLSALIKWIECGKLFGRLADELASWPLFTKLLFIITWLIILFINAGPVVMDDTESYHIQSIKWIQEYGTVPGLVNLHERFGFNSSWFSSVALFGFSKNTAGGYTVLNGVLSLWLVYWLVSKQQQLFKEKKYPASFALLIIFITCMAVWPLTRGNAASANYDFIATAVVLVLFAESILSEEKRFLPGVEWVIWPVYLFTVRIIHFPFLLISLASLVFFIRQKSLKALLTSLACCLLLIIPFLARNIILTGYPFYPAVYFDWFSTDWKADPEITGRLLAYIKYYNRVSTAYFDIEQTRALGSGWIPAWFQHLFLFDKILVAGGVTGLIGSVVLLSLQKKFYNKNSIIFIAAISFWLICWFIISPDPRFVYGCLLAGIFLASFYFTSFIKNQKAGKWLTDSVMILLIAGSVFYLVSKPIKQEEYRNWVTAAALPQPPVKEVTIDGITFRIPEPIHSNWNARCYGTPLPCLYKPAPRLQPRGNTIRSGFRLK